MPWRGLCPAVAKSRLNDEFLPLITKNFFYIDLHLVMLLRNISGDIAEPAAILPDQRRGLIRIVPSVIDLLGVTWSFLILLGHLQVEAYVDVLQATFSVAACQED